MHQILISILCGCMIFYATPAMSMELLMLEQQLTLLMHEPIVQKPDTNIRSVANLLKSHYKLMKQNNVKPYPYSSLEDIEKYFIRNKQLYNESIKIPITDEHLDWNKWLMIPKAPLVDQLEAILAFGAFMCAFYDMIYHIIIEKGLEIDSIEEKLPQFNELVSLLQLALPVESNRKQIGEKLVNMWTDITLLKKSFQLKSIQPESEQVRNFFKKYPDASLWFLYLYELSQRHLQRFPQLRDVFFDALYISRAQFEPSDLTQALDFLYSTQQNFDNLMKDAYDQLIQRRRQLLR
jgi:hypothetical protein